MSLPSNVRVFHILVQHEYEAKDILLKLKSTEQFQEFAKKFSTCSSARAGGDLGVYKAGRFVEAFEDACEDLPLNQVSKPVRTKFGWHLILKM
jgi:peptidyl-prolyl cis-trans isomerase C